MQNGENTENNTMMASILNNYFATVFTEEINLEQQPTPRNQSNNVSLTTCTFEENKILQAISKIKVNKTPGTDRISPRILKEAKNELAKPLSILFSKSLNTGKVPDEW